MGSHRKGERSFTLDAVYLQTNDAENNEVVAFRRAEDGTLSKLGTYATGGRGTGKPHLASQSSVVAGGDRLLVVNAGSDDVSLFAISDDRLALLRRVVLRRGARACEQERREHAQRSLLGGRDEGRALRLRNELRRRHDLELRDRPRRLARARRCGCGVDDDRREGRA